MFSSSSNGISPFSQVSPFLNWNPSSSSLNSSHENLLSHQEDLLSLYFSYVSPTIDTSSNIKNPETIIGTKKKKTKKTDRHSKIFTAQGPRDRRVRLSIDISKKFFGLQDLLGFDKASLTLDWLLNNSKPAISELLRANNIEDTCLCSFLSEDRRERTEAGDSSVVGSKETVTTTSKRKGRNRKAQSMSALDKVAKESRMKARQRARERTRVKVSLRNILGAASQEQQQSLFSPASINYQWGQIGSSKSAVSSRQSTLTSSNEHSAADPVEGFFFVNPRTGEVNLHRHHQEDAFSESANFTARTKLDFNLWRSSMNHDDLF